MKNNSEIIQYFEPPSGAENQFSKDELAALAFINQKIAAGEGLREIIEFLFAEIQPLIPCDRIGVSFIDEDGSRMTLHTVAANYSPLYLSEGYSSEIAGSSLKKIFDSGTPRIISDMEAYIKINPGSESSELLLKEGVLSSMTCPLRVEERAVGLLFFSSRRAEAFTGRMFALQTAVTERLSQAVEKAFRIEELTAAINSYIEMLSFVTHELKSPLDSIITMGRTLAEGYYGPLDEKHRDLIMRMVKKGEYLSSVSAEYLNLSRFEGNTVKKNFRGADFISEVINPCLDLVQPQIDEKKIILEKNFLNPPSLVFCNPDLMKIAVNNLLSNAVKYGIDGGIIRLTLSYADEILRLTLWNEGPGFSQENKKMLFKKFSRIDSSPLMQRKGSGIGLYISWKIILLHGGKIRAESDEGRWAEFNFEIPLNSAGG